MLDGHSIPQFGLGVYEMDDKETYNAVKWALEAGYRHVDTAEWYVSSHASCGGIARLAREVAKDDGMR
jgi:diketogulonate reductase-like aldo/keto reductase